MRMRLALAASVAAMALPAAAQTMDQAAVERACGGLEREWNAGRTTVADVVACANREAARQLNARMPVRVDEITTVESVAALGTEFLYNVRVDMEAAAVTAAMRQALSDGTRNYACNAQDMRRTIGNGGSYRYRWSDRAGRFIHEALIDRC